MHRRTSSIQSEKKALLDPSTSQMIASRNLQCVSEFFYHLGSAFYVMGMEMGFGKSVCATEIDKS